MKNLFVLVCLIIGCSNFCHSQQNDINNDTISIQNIQVNKILKKHPKSALPPFIIEDYNLILIKLDVEIFDGVSNLLDPNKFSLITITENLNYRFRPSDVFLIESKKAWLRFKFVTKKKPILDNQYQVLFDPNIPDTYLDYKIGGANNINIPFNLGDTETVDRHVLHFRPLNITKGKLAFYFLITSDFIKEGVLYYGNKKLSKLNF